MTSADAYDLVRLASELYGRASIARAEGAATVTLDIEGAQKLARLALDAVGVDLVDAGGEGPGSVAMAEGL